MYYWHVWGLSDHNRSNSWRRIPQYPWRERRPYDFRYPMFAPKRQEDSNHQEEDTDKVKDGGNIMYARIDMRRTKPATVHMYNIPLGSVNPSAAQILFRTKHTHGHNLILFWLVLRGRFCKLDRYFVEFVAFVMGSEPTESDSATPHRISTRMPYSRCLDISCFAWTLNRVKQMVTMRLNERL